MSTYIELVNRAEAAALSAEQSAQNTATDKSTIQGYLTRMEGLLNNASTITDPSISVNVLTGVVTASCTASTGNVLQSVTKSNTLNLQTVQNINLDPSIIKNGETVLGVTGTYQGSGGGGQSAMQVYLCTEVLDDGSYSYLSVSGCNHPDYQYDGTYLPYGTTKVNGEQVYRCNFGTSEDPSYVYLYYNGYEWGLSDEWDDEYPGEGYFAYVLNWDGPTGTYQSESVVNEDEDGFDWDDESTWVYASCTVTEARSQATRTPSWSGKLGTAGANGYTFASTVTTGLVINSAYTPEVGQTYTSDGYPIQVPIAGITGRQDDCMLYVPLNGSVTPIIGELGQTFGDGNNAGITFPTITYGQTTRQVMQTTGNTWFIYNMIRRNIAPITVALLTKPDPESMDNDNRYTLVSLWTDKGNSGGPAICTDESVSNRTWHYDGSNRPIVQNRWTSVVMVYGGVNQTSIYIDGVRVENDITGSRPINAFRTFMNQYGNETAKPICSLGGPSNNGFLEDRYENYSISDWAVLSTNPIYKGQICEFGIWAREWTKDEIAAHAAIAVSMRA